MIRFLMKRLGLMVFTLGGVILLTFVLFNMVGGSPAKLILGEQAAPQQIEEYELARGLNKPLFYGHWKTTRALEDSVFGEPGGSLSSWISGEDGWITEAGQRSVIPLGFSLQTGKVHRLELVFKTQHEAVVEFGSSAKGTLPASGDAFVMKHFTFTPSGHDIELAVQTDEGSLSVESAKLRMANDSPWSSQFSFYLKQIVTFDFGVSHFSHQRVSTMLKDGIGPTLMLAIPILIGSLVVSIVLSLVCAYWRDRWPDRVLVLLSVGLMSINYLVWIVAGQYVLAYKLQWFPVWGFESWSFLILPVLIGIFSGLGPDIRLYRTVMLDEMYRDYVRTAKAKGCSTRAILFRHVLRNALIPIVTNLSMVLPFLYTGSLLLETYFGIPGLGYLSINGIFNRDFDVVRAVVLIGSVLYMFSNLFADLLYAVVDPRVKVN